jgi:putative ABC transport system substrate-binding protein
MRPQFQESHGLHSAEALSTGCNFPSIRGRKVPLSTGCLAAGVRGLRLEVCEVRTSDELPIKVEAATKSGATGLTILETPTLLSIRRQIADLAAKLRLFAIYTSRDFVDAGGLMSYAADRRQQYRHAAELVAKILEGDKPADIPVEQPTKFQLIINLRTARMLGIDIPLKLLATADAVIK